MPILDRLGYRVRSINRGRTDLAPGPADSDFSTRPCQITKDVNYKITIDPYTGNQVHHDKREKMLAYGQRTQATN